MIPLHPRASRPCDRASVASIFLFILLFIILRAILFHIYTILLLSKGDAKRKVLRAYQNKNTQSPCAVAAEYAINSVFAGPFTHMY